MSAERSHRKKDNRLHPPSIDYILIKFQQGTFCSRTNLRDNGWKVFKLINAVKQNSKHVSKQSRLRSF